MKKLLLIATGGTISQKKDEKLGTALSSDQSTGAKEFLEFLQDLVQRAHIDIAIDAKEILNKDSSNIIPADWKLMIDTILEAYDVYDAFLILHGTNTLGYTSAALSFALGKLGKPVILTGSQVSFGYAGSDAVMNLENAMRVAAVTDPELRGVFAVFGSHIITGVRVKKTTEFEYDAFKTFSGKASLGRIGRSLRWDKAALANHHSWLEPLARDRSELDVKAKFEMDLASLTEFPGMKWEVFKSLVEGGAKGIILRATGAGDPNVAKPEDKYENLRKGFEYLKEKEIPIVVTTQAPDGLATMDVNEPGQAAYKLGGIPAWDMSIEAITVKLGWLLGRKIPYEEMRTMMLQPVRGEIESLRR